MGTVYNRDPAQKPSPKNLRTLKPDALKLKIPKLYPTKPYTTETPFLSPKRTSYCKDLTTETWIVPYHEC